MVRSIVLFCTAFMASAAAGLSVNQRLGWWAPLPAHTALVAAIVAAALAALTFIPVERLSRRAAHAVQDNRGTAAVSLVTVGVAVAVAFLIARP